MKRVATIVTLVIVASCSPPPEDKDPVVVVEDAGRDLNTTSDQGRPDDLGTRDAGDDCRVTGCPEDLVCNSLDGICVGCVSDAECGDDARCDPEKNECVCDEGTRDCDGVCRPLDSVDACGPNCEVCAGAPGGEATCTAGTCGVTCDAPLEYDAAANRCVGCLRNADCPSAEASACSGGSCEPCNADQQCAHVTGRPMCRGGACVECTATDESACGPNSCDPATGTCTSTPRGSVGVCEPCAADSECIDGHLCVVLEFQGTPRDTPFCVPVEGQGCSAPYPVSATRTSVSGVPSTVCTVNEDLATCEAVADYFKGCGDASDCGAPGLDDGICEPLDFDRAGCSYLCASPDECPSTSVTGCFAGSLDAKWCGAY